MAAQVIYLDVDDEITSAVTRIRQAPAGGVVIVVPYGSRLASSRINFRLLAREAAVLQRDLTIVTPDAGTRALAASAGLVTHATVLEWEQLTAAGSVPEPRPGPGTPGPGATPPMDAAATAPGLRPRGVRSGDPARGRSQVPPQDGAPPQMPPARPTPPETSRIAVSAASVPVVGPPRRLAFNRTRAMVAVVVLALLAAVAGYAATAILPSAEITIAPAAEAVGPLSLTVTADPSITIAEPARSAVPAVRLSLPISVSATFQATGKLVTDVKATGSVRIDSYNTGSATTIPAGTLVKTSDGIDFLTNAAVTVDKATIVNPTKTVLPASASVGVTASASGAQANVAIAAIRILPAKYDSQIYNVTNPAPTAGGVHTESPQVQKSDVDAALATLRTRLTEAYAAKLADPASISAGTKLVAQTQKLGEATPTTDPNTLVNQTVATFDLGLGATATAIAVNPGPVTGLAESRLAASLPAGYDLVATSTRITVDPPAAIGEAVTFAVRARGERVREIDVEALRRQVLGKSIAAARTVLEPFGDVRITVWPDWVTSIPGSLAKVRLTVTQPASESPAPSGGSPAPSGSIPVASLAIQPSRSPSVAPVPSGSQK